MRKVLGANRRQLFFQLIAESIIITLLSVFLALIISTLLLPTFNEYFDRTFSMITWLKPDYILFLLSIVLLTIIIAGGYSSLLISGLLPTKTLKGATDLQKTGFIKKSLIVFQYTITGVLIVVTLSINHQLNFVQNKNVGYNKNNIVTLSADQYVQDNITAIKTELKKNPSVISITTASEDPTFIQGGYSIRRANMSANQVKSVNAVSVDEDYVKTVGLTILAGRDLRDIDLKQATLPDRASQYQHYLLNEEAVKSLGWTIQESIGKEVVFGGYLGRIEGVVKDFHFDTMKNKIKPLVIYPDLGARVLLINYSSENKKLLLESLRGIWSKVAPQNLFDYEFLSDKFNKIYIEENRTKGIIVSSAVLAILLACLGMFSLSVYSVNLRKKEISIRKVLGASNGIIVLLLVKEMLLLIAISFLLFTPFAWIFTERWLSSFVYRTGVEPFYFLSTYFIILTLSILAVIYQTIKAASAKPVTNLNS